MYDYLLCAICYVWILQTGFCDEECNQGVLARRGAYDVPAGGSLSLSCVVQHCGDTWTGTWMWKNSTYEKFSTVKESARHRLTKETLSANKTQLVLKLLRADPLDEGSYQCSVIWAAGNTEQGHLTTVNITAAVLSQRILWHRVLICAGAFLCFPIVVGLAHCLSSEVKHQLLPMATLYTAVERNLPPSAPQPPPRRPVPQKRKTTPNKAVRPKQQQNIEVVYADISQDALREQRAMREPTQSTVYSSVRFP
uniref:Ig-like domain-containing protein n=1 Tax=Amphiprion percula TaxID=161767 RepID=A0A3P8U8Z8_AMPPE